MKESLCVYVQNQKISFSLVYVLKIKISKIDFLKKLQMQLKQLMLKLCLVTAP